MVVAKDQQTILIGGLMSDKVINTVTKIPLLGDIPILGFFFKEEGYSDERQSLMILIRAWISDVKEELARLEER